MVELLLPLLTGALVFNFGLHRLRHAPAAARTVNLTLVQPAIPQTLIWDTSKSGERFQDLLRLSEQALSNQTDVLVWPEGGVPGFLRYDADTAAVVSGLARRHHVWMMVGSDDFERRPGAVKPEDGDYFNACFLINPDGELAGQGYHKRNLVIFGEYVPCLRWLPFLKWFTPIQGGFTPGQAPGLFTMPALGITASMLICFEDVFPQLDWGGPESGADFLVTLTNDGWFGEGAEQWQHAVSALFRTVERGVPLVRCANNGITCWIDAQGRLKEVLRDVGGSPNARGFITFPIPVSTPGVPPARTFYGRHGDWFGWGCFGAAALLVANLLRRRQAEARARRRREMC